MSHCTGAGTYQVNTCKCCMGISSSIGLCKWHECCMSCLQFTQPQCSTATCAVHRLAGIKQQAQPFASWAPDVQHHEELAQQDAQPVHPQYVQLHTCFLLDLHQFCNGIFTCPLHAREFAQHTCNFLCMFHAWLAPAPDIQFGCNLAAIWLQSDGCNLT